MGTYFRNFIKVTIKESSDINEFDEYEIQEILTKKIWEVLKVTDLYTIEDAKNYVSEPLSYYMDGYEYPYILFENRIKYYSLEEIKIRHKDYKFQIFSFVDYK